MGIRHAQGALGVEAVEKVTIVDIFQTALDNAKTTLQSSPNFSKCTFCLPDELGSETFDTGILASTADARDKSYQLLVSLGCQNILVEKPLGQSYHEVCAFNDVVLKSGRNCAVNLNMRLNENFIKI